jgi:hypothetical protein
MNIANTIIPKSDQLNADDLITGPRTIKITAVKSGSDEQPVVIAYEGDNSRPYKPSKSMRRVLIVAWGAEGSAYVGRRLTLYRDPLIKFGGEPVGGIAISHMSDIDGPLVIALTVSRGKKKQFRVAPIAAEDLPLDEGRDPIAEAGASAAANGMTALQAFWASLSPATQKAYKQTLDAEWKPIAERGDAQ